jgi:hypothetical protein
MLIMFALLIVPVTFAVGVVAVDASMWQSERRGAQKDADLAALAAAQAFLWDGDHPEGTNNPAKLEAMTYADLNNDSGATEALQAVSMTELQNGAAGVAVGNTCFDGAADPTPELLFNSVEINLRHTSRAFFSSVFGVEVVPDIGAHARACAGAIIRSGAATDDGGEGLPDQLPLAIDAGGTCFESGGPSFRDGEPFDCILEYGMLRAVDMPDGGDICSDAGAGASLPALIASGARGDCVVDANDTCAGSGAWRDCVAVRALDAEGAEPCGSPDRDECAIMHGLDARLASTGTGCNTFDNALDQIDGNDHHDDREHNVYAARLCDGGAISPRLVTLFVLHDEPASDPGNAGHDVRGFAVFHVEACRFEVTNSDPPDDPPWDPACQARTAADRVQVGVRFVRLLAQGDIGPADETTTSFGIALDD